MGCHAAASLRAPASSNPPCVVRSAGSIRFSFGFKRLNCAMLVLLLLKPCRLPACGPFFPNNLLDGGDQAVLVAPLVNFERELQRMKMIESRFKAVPLEANTKHNNFSNQSL